MSNHFQDFLVIDIETVSGSEDIEKLPPALKKHWERKAEFIRKPEEKSAEDLYEDRAAIYAEFGKVIVIGMGFFHETDGQPALRVKSIASENEAALLNEFRNFIEEKFDQENLRLCAHNGKEFDFPYIARRMVINKIPIPEKLNLFGKKPWEVPHLDTMELWKFGDFKHYTSLKLLTKTLGIPSPKEDIDGSQVANVYYKEKNLNRIVTYCEKDVIAIAQLIRRFRNEDLLEESDIIVV